MFVIRANNDTNADAIKTNYFLKLFPPYLFGASLIDICSGKLYSTTEKRSFNGNLYGWMDNG